MTINERVKELRSFLKMNQSTFGEKIGIAQTYLSQIEKGDRDVTDKISKIICLTEWNGRKVSEDWLQNGMGDMFVEVTEKDKATAIAKSLLHGYKADDEVCRLILDIVEIYNELPEKEKSALKELIERVRKREI